MAPLIDRPHDPYFDDTLTRPGNVSGDVISDTETRLLIACDQMCVRITCDDVKTLTFETLSHEQLASEENWRAAGGIVQLEDGPRLLDPDTDAFVEKAVRGHVIDKWGPYIAVSRDTDDPSDAFRQIVSAHSIMAMCGEPMDEAADCRIYATLADGDHALLYVLEPKDGYWQVKGTALDLKQAHQLAKAHA